MSTQTYRLHSSAMFHSPGVIKWAINGYAFKDDRESLRNTINGAYPEIPVGAIEKLLTGEVPYKVEDETVVFTVEA